MERQEPGTQGQTTLHPDATPRSSTEVALLPLDAKPHLRTDTYRSDIDGLRAVAILSVLVFHFFPTALPAGFIGVDIFFVISGFLISTLIVERLSSQSFSFLDFYCRRIKRIFPALLVLLLALLGLGNSLLLTDEYRSLLKEVAVGTSFGSNLLRWHEGADYFNHESILNPLLHLWSLGVEEQFYVLWPLLLWLSWKSPLTRLPAIISVGLVSFWLNATSIDDHSIATFYSPQTRFWELSIGALLAHRQLFPPPARRSADHGDLLSWMGMLVLLVAFLVVSPERAYPGWWALLPTIGTVLMIAAGQEASLNRMLLTSRALVWIGLISFPLYLWHWPILSLIHILTGDTPSLVFRWIALICSVALAWLTYEFVEKPIRAGGRLRLKALSLVLLTGIVGAFSFERYATESPQPTVVDIAPREAKPQYVDNTNVFGGASFMANFTNSACIQRLKGFNFPGTICRASEHVAPSIALIGDSHAYSIYGFVNHAAEAHNRGVILLGNGGCPPFLGITRVLDADAKCARAMAAAVDFVNQDAAITDVFLTGWFAEAMNRTFVLHRHRPRDFHSIKLVAEPSITDPRMVFRKGLSSMIKELTQAGKQVTIILDFPELDFQPKRCLGHRGNHPCTISRELVEERQSSYVQIIRELQAEYDFKILDIKNALCNAESCSAKDGNYILYLDDHHLGINGNIFLVNSGLQIL